MSMPLTNNAMTFPPQRKKVWFVTGTSSGLGRELVRTIVGRGDKVIATARNLCDIEDLRSESCHIIQLDVTSEASSIRAVVKQALDVWGYVDVVVNNAGAGIIGFFEEIGDGIMQLMQINYFGPINVTNAFLPHLRRRRTGTIIFVGSRSSWRTNNPMTGEIFQKYLFCGSVKTAGGYCAAKAAISAAAESLSVELAPFNIRVLNVLPGGLRTKNWENVMSVSSKKSRISDYDPVRRKVFAWVAAQAGNEVGDPVKAASVLVDIVKDEGLVRANTETARNGNTMYEHRDSQVGLVTSDSGSRGRGWPVALALGYDADRDIREKCAKVMRSLDEWKGVACAIAYDD